MKTIIAGSRWIASPAARRFLVKTIQELPWSITEVVSGRARGVDTMGEWWARVHDIPVRQFPAHWYPDGSKGGIDLGAGFKRNEEMAVYADALLAMWDGSSKGTKHMIDTARLHNLQIVRVIWLSDFVHIKASE
jgi:hypothetical protein